MGGDREMSSCLQDLLEQLRGIGHQNRFSRLEYPTVAAVEILPDRKHPALRRNLEIGDVLQGDDFLVPQRVAGTDEASEGQRRCP